MRRWRRSSGTATVPEPTPPRTHYGVFCTGVVHGEDAVFGVDRRKTQVRSCVARPTSVRRRSGGGARVVHVARAGAELRAFREQDLSTINAFCLFDIGLR